MLRATPSLQQIHLAADNLVYYITTKRNRANVIFPSNIFTLVALSNRLCDCGNIVKLRSTGVHFSEFENLRAVYLEMKCRLSD